MVVITQSPPGYSTPSSLTTYVTYHMHSLVKISIYKKEKGKKALVIALSKKLSKLVKFTLEKKSKFLCQKLTKFC
jgi:hypothetical protein